VDGEERERRGAEVGDPGWNHLVALPSFLWLGGSGGSGRSRLNGHHQNFGLCSLRSACPTGRVRQ
jgi:hypothetical protein